MPLVRIWPAALLLCACTGTGAPSVEAGIILDTHDTHGPYPVLARAFDDRGVDRVELVWKLDGADGFVRERMKKQGEDLWRGEIAGAAAGATVLWMVEAVDTDANRAAAPPPDANGLQWFSFRVLQ